MYTSDKQMLKIPSLLKKKGIISLIQDFHDETGIPKQLFSNVKNQEKINRTTHFTPEHIEKVCTMYGINFNWIFGTSDEIFINKHQAQKVHK